jgi:uncharacterized protein YfaS (alpha-2-macroglobulin family)
MKTPQRIANLFALAVILSSSLLGACAPTPAPTPTPLPPTATATTSPQPTLAPTSAPTPTSKPAGAPTVIGRTPARGEELKPDQPIVISFDQPMDEASLKAAFAIEPALPGSLSVKGNDVIFTPAKPFERGASYQITLSEKAKSVAGQSLAKAVTFKVQTVGYLEVTTVQPADRAQDIASDATIMVVFNRPVVPLVAIEKQKDLPQPLTLDPPAKGEGAWINTSIYAFRPSEPLASATIYRATVKAGLTDMTGGILAKDYTWSFSTTQPRVESLAPGGAMIAPTTVVTVTFNQPMDRASTEAAFKLTEQGAKDAVAGAFKWLDGGKTLIFTPAAALKFGQQYTIELAPGAKASAGVGRIAQSSTATFTVVQLPRVTQTRPANGDKAAEVSGGVEIWFSAPLLESTIGPNIYILPKPTNVYTYYSGRDSGARNETRLWINFDRQPQTDYTITLGAGISDPYGNTLGKDYVLRFHTGDLPAALYFNTPGVMGTYNTYTGTNVSISYRNVTSLKWQLYQLPPERLQAMLSDTDIRMGYAYAPPAGDLLREGTLPVDVPRNARGVATLRLGEAPDKSLPPGAYFLTINAPEIVINDKSWRPPHHVLVVSPYQMLLKAGSNQALVWVTDVASGAPVKGVPITLFGDPTGKLGSGVTDEHGVFLATFKPRDMWRDMVAIAGAPGDRFGAVANSWNSGLAPFEFDLTLEPYRSDYVGYLYTERPIYRPTQTVYFKGFVRSDDDARYSLPAGLDKLSVSVRDPDGNEVYSKTLPIDSMGGLNGELQLSEAAPLGYYEIEASKGDFHIYTSFQVAEYRKPEYEVTVSTDAKDYIQGDVISATLQSTYYFGGPVRDAGVTWNILRRNYWFQYQGEGWWDFNDVDWWELSRYKESFGEKLSDGKGKTDADGRFAFKVPADISKEKLSQVFTLDVQVTDVNDQVVSSRSEVIVHKGAFYIGLRPKEYVSSAGQETAVEIITVDKDSKPVPNTKLQVVAYSTRWDSVQEKGQDGRLYWTSKLYETPVLTRTVATDAAGKGSFVFTPETGGTYRVRAVGRDARENEVRSSTFVWVSARKGEFVSWRRENNNRITLVADKKEYKPGDTANILIPSPYQGSVQALVTVERGRLLDTRLVTLNSNSDRIQIPITDDYIPNVYISVAIVKGQDRSEPFGSMRLGYINLPVSSDSKKLKVEISTEKTTYQPRDKVTYKIRATDWMGKPAQAEFTLSLVDLAVLALGGPSQTDLFTNFWRQRGVGFQTASSITLAVDRLTQAVETETAAGKGGGGGGPGGELFVRSRFADTAYWNPTVVTDRNGEATLTVTLPDNLTTWRMEARGLTAATQAGRQTNDIVATQPLLVRPVLPRFFVIGDQGQISAIVHNNTDKEIEATVSLAAAGMDTKDALEQKVKVPAHDLARLSWMVTIKSVEQVKVRYTAQGGGLSDAVEITLPVYHPSTPEVVATAGQLDAAGELTESIVLPEVLDPTEGELTVTIDPSLAAGMRDGLSYLEHYPYECIEQTVSRFLPNVMAYRAMTALGIQDKELETRLPQMVSIGLQRIYARQRYNGGWGWWLSDEPDEYLTAYVLYGLSEAQKAGFLVDKKVMEKAAGFLREKAAGRLQLTASTWEANRQAFLLFALANYDAPAGNAAQYMSKAVLLYESRDKLGLWAKALLAMTLRIIDPKEKSRVDTLMSDLNNKAIVSAAGAHWEEAYADFRNMNTDTRTTAIVLSAIADTDPKQPLGPNAVRWLMAVRKDGRWESTYETTWSLLGLTNWMIATGELQADYSYSVDLNGKPLTEGMANKVNVGQEVKLRTAVKDLLLDQANALTIKRSAAAGQSGQGRLYYAANLKYYLPVNRIKAMDRGIVISREYRLVDQPDKTITQAKIGDVIEVRLTLIAPNDLHYVVVEDPLPAGCEALDTSLETTSRTIRAPELQKTDQQAGPWWMWWWNSWWSPTHTELRDEKVALFATYLARGTYQYSYLIRASLPGQFLILPAQAYEMYFPDVFGRTDGAMFSVVR